jgi:hypothetical protein
VRAFKDAMNSLGVRALSVNDDGSENWDLIEINAAIERVGLDGWVKLCRYYQDRHERGLDILESLTAEIREMARVAAMPTKLVRDKTGRSVGAQKVPGLGKLH